MHQVFITGAGAYLPNDPVSNDEMEAVLGQINSQPSRYREKILDRNGIKQRYYALKDGKQTHLNEELAANAIKDLFARTKTTINDIEMLVAGTTVPDTILPSFASMIHGRLGGKPMEIVSGAGICCSSMIAFKAAVNALRCGDHNNAIAVGSDLSSSGMKASRFTRESEVGDQRETENDSFKYFNADFLRWMLSDGAGAWLLENKPRAGQLSLRVDWVRICSYANQYPTCMYMGTSKTRDLSPSDSYLSYDNYAKAEEAGLLIVRQDTQLLPVGLIGSIVKEAEKLKMEGLIVPERIDHFLPHLSSMVFFESLYNEIAKVGVEIPKNRWFTNLKTKGNTAAASIFIMLEEALNGGLFKDGETILIMVPESGRFMSCYVHLTCVTN
jgi:3-oxoacyl-[acyl-carrier-protein] synthase-3